MEELTEKWKAGSIRLIQYSLELKYGKKNVKRKRRSSSSSKCIFGIKEIKEQKSV